MASFHAYFKLSWVEVQWVHQFFETPIKIRLFLVRMIIRFFLYLRFSRNHNYDHLLIVALFSFYNIKQKLTKKFVDFIIFFVNFQNFTKIIFFEVMNIHKPSLESGEVPHTIWARSVQTFWRLLDTNRLTVRKKTFLKKR